VFLFLPRGGLRIPNALRWLGVLERLLLLEDALAVFVLFGLVHVKVALSLGLCDLGEELLLSHLVVVGDFFC
jgi:hypothetical protein